MRNLGELRGSNSPFLTSAAQLEKLIASINDISQCKSEGCEGKLRLKSIELVGMGGDATAHFTCSGGCGTRNVCLPCSEPYKDSQQSVLSVSLQIAFICSGANYAQYEKVLGSLGMHPVSDQMFYEIIQVLYAPVKTLLDSQCELGKREMQSAPTDQIGSWNRAVTVGDGVWQTRGHHSQNFTFHIRDHVRNSVLYYLHLCQRGKDSMCEEPLYEGTSGSCEGVGAGRLFSQMHKEGMFLVVHWQDADSSSANEVTKYFPKCNVMLCSGHYTRAHFLKLKKIQGQNFFGGGDKAKYKGIYPAVETVQCHCSRHKQGCGCITDAFCSESRKKLFRAVMHAGANPDKLKSRIRMLPYHARDEHKWKDGKCDFHELLLCSCGSCGVCKIRCEGKRYKTANVLTCPYHALAYEIECEFRARQAENVIHPELGKGHTSQVESSHSALIRFRQKSWCIRRLHYHVSTNLGLMESNQTFMINTRGVDYYWLPELFQSMGLPDFDGARAFFKIKNRKRIHKCEVRQTEASKRKMSAAKHRHRVTEQQNRKLVVSKQKIAHMYASNTEYAFEPEHDVESQACPPTEIADISRGKRKPCACGSTTHSRKTSKSCPLNISNVKSMQAPHREHLHVESKVIVEEPNDASNLDLTDEFEHSEVLSELEGLYSDDSPLPSSDEDEFDDFDSLTGICDCGRAHKRTCPLNPRFLSQCQKRGNGPKGDEVRSRVGKGVASKSSAVRRGSDTLSGPPVKKAKVVTRMATRVRRPITPSKSPVSRPSRLGKSRARVSRDLLCAGSKPNSSNDIEADDHSSNIEA